MIDPAVFICAPIEFLGCKIYPPTVRDVVTISNFPSYQKIFTITQDELEHEHQKNKGKGNSLTPLEFVLGCCYNSSEFLSITEEAF